MNFVCSRRGVDGKVYVLYMRRRVEKGRNPKFGVSELVVASATRGLSSTHGDVILR